MIDRLGSTEVDPEVVIKELVDKIEKDDSVRHALLLSLGEFGGDRPPLARRKELIPRLTELYKDRQPGVRGAAEWLLRKWARDDPSLEIAKKLAEADKELARREEQLQAGDTSTQGYWYVNTQGQTMVIFPRTDNPFLMGSPPTEVEREQKYERQHKRVIRHVFAMAAKEVTVDQFLRFPGSKDESNQPVYVQPTSPTGDCPINNVSWYKAAEYCNWLSLQEGIPPEQRCYEANANGNFAEGMKLKPNYLDLTGYRLPTEPEWEYACRGGALTSYHFGDSPAVLGKYAWFSANSRESKMLPVGSLKPNDFGLFDMHGNAVEWCQTLAEYPKEGEAQPVGDSGQVETIANPVDRVLRGGSYYSQQQYLRCANRFHGYGPYKSFKSFGFRPARTYPYGGRKAEEPR